MIGKLFENDIGRLLERIEDAIMEDYSGNAFFMGRIVL